MNIRWDGNSLKNAGGELASVNANSLFYQGRTLQLHIKRFPNFVLNCELGTCRSGFTTTNLEIHCGTRSYLAQKQRSARIIRAQSADQAVLLEQQAELMQVDLISRSASITASGQSTQDIFPIADQVFIMTAIYLVDLQRELRI